MKQVVTNQFGKPSATACDIFGGIYRGFDKKLASYIFRNVLFNKQNLVRRSHKWSFSPVFFEVNAAVMVSSVPFVSLDVVSSFDIFRMIKDSSFHQTLSDR